jgi:DNA-binding winged helix-turn-helix (wHTH) protein
MQFRFADHVLDVALRELRRQGEVVALEPQVFDLLIHLIRNRHQVVTKEDLVASVVHRCLDGAGSLSGVGPCAF